MKPRYTLSLLGLAMVGLTLWLAFAAFTSEAISQARVPLPVTDASLASVAFSDSVFSVGEADGSATITVTLSAASELTVTVDYATSDGTAKADSDYITKTGTMTFATDETSGPFDVPIINDTFDERDETVLLTLSNPHNAELGTPITATLTIVDDDPPSPVYLPLICKAPSCLTAEEEPNNTASDADRWPPLCKDTWAAGNLPDDGDSDDVYWIRVDRHGTLVVDLDLRDIPPGRDYDLFVYDNDKQKIGESRKFGTEPEHIEISVEPGKYYLRVNPYTGRSDQNYYLMWSLRD